MVKCALSVKQLNVLNLLLLTILCSGLTILQLSAAASGGGGSGSAGYDAGNGAGGGGDERRPSRGQKRTGERATGISKLARTGLSPAEQQLANQALIAAAESGDLMAVLAAVGQGADIDAHAPITIDGQMEPGQTALIAAASQGHLDIVTALLTAGANVNATATIDLRSEDETQKVYRGATALILAARNGHTPIVRALSTNGAVVDTSVSVDTVQGADRYTFHNRTALTIAVDWGRLEIVKLLLRAGANVNAQETMVRADNGHNYPCHTPLTTILDSQNPHLRAAEARTAIVSALLAAGANVNTIVTSWITDYELQGGVTALMLAARYGCLEIVQALLAAGADVNLATTLIPGQYVTGWTALLLATRYNHTEVVRALIAAGANVNTHLTFMVNGQPQPGNNSLMLAIQNRNIDMMQILLNAGANVNATAKHCIDLEYQFEDAADFASDLDDNMTALELAVSLVWNQQALGASAVQLLLAAGGSLTPQGVERLSPNDTIFIEQQRNTLKQRARDLRAAAVAGDIDQIRALSALPLYDRKRNLSIALLNATGSHLPLAQFQAVATLLLELGADVNFALPIDMSADLRTTETAPDTAAAGAGGRAENSAAAGAGAAALPIVTEDLRPLDIAILGNLLEKVRFLLPHGADPLQLAERTQQRLSAFTVTERMPVAEQRALRKAELAADPVFIASYERWIQKTPERASLEQAQLARLRAAANELYLDDAFAIAALMERATFEHSSAPAAFEAMKAAGERRQMAQ